MRPDGRRGQAGTLTRGQGVGERIEYGVLSMGYRSTSGGGHIYSALHAVLNAVIHSVI